VLLADDHGVLRSALKDLINMSGGFVVVDEVANGADALSIIEAAQEPIDIVLMDVNMPGLGGIDTTRRIRETHPEIDVIALSAMGDLENVQGMIQAGAAGYVLKGGSPEELLRSLTAVGEGKGVLDDTVTRDVFNEMSRLYREEKARADELAELSRMKTEFISIVSHELQTPLAIIKAGLHLLHHRNDAVDEETREVFFRSVEQETVNLISVVDQMLTVAEIQGGSLHEDASRIMLADVARAAAASVIDPEAAQRVKLDIRDNTATVLGDRSKLRKVAAALIDNALMFSRGPVHVIVDTDGKWGTLKVLDQGPGLDETIRYRVLEEPFIQADSSNTREHGGLGLSLYVAHGLLKAFGGELAIDDDFEGGSFEIRLPIQVPVPAGVEVVFG
jgi:signal transduction histidine kinase